MKNTIFSSSIRLIRYLLQYFRSKNSNTIFVIRKDVYLRWRQTFGNCGQVARRRTIEPVPAFCDHGCAIVINTNSKPGKKSDKLNLSTITQYTKAASPHNLTLIAFHDWSLKFLLTVKIYNNRE